MCNLQPSVPKAPTEKVTEILPHRGVCGQAQSRTTTAPANPWAQRDSSMASRTAATAHMPTCPSTLWAPVPSSGSSFLSPSGSFSSGPGLASCAYRSVSLVQAALQESRPPFHFFPGPQCVHRTLQGSRGKGTANRWPGPGGVGGAAGHQYLGSLTRTCAFQPGTSKWLTGRQTLIQGTPGRPSPGRCC